MAQPVIYGVGTSSFGRQPSITASELVWTAVREARADAGDVGIDAVYLGTVFGEMGVAQRALHRLGITGVPIIRVENACASGTTAFTEATHAVESGRYETVLVVGVEQMSASIAGAIPLEPLDPDGAGGLALPALYAMAASRYQYEYGVMAEQLALVTVKNRRHAEGHPRNQFTKPVSVADVLAAPMIADPLTRLMCSPICDAAAAAVVGAERGNPADVIIRSSVLRSGGLWDHTSEHVWGFEVVRDTTALALEEAAVEITDIDFFEVHDAFTIGEIVTTEALGLADEGDGVHLLQSGATALGGKYPVNASGGLLSRGHPLGATGVAQIAEAVWQLRGTAGARQVEGARFGLVETMGGGVAGLDGNACVVAVLEAPHSMRSAR